MQELDQEPAFILRRTPYQENQYLLDIFTRHYGRMRGIARITKQKTHRETDHLAPFRALQITGRRKAELLTVTHSDICRHFPLRGQQWLTGLYINELLLRCTEAEHPDKILYDYYQTALITPEASEIRQIEWHLIQEQGLLPERCCDAQYYRLYREHDWFSLRAATSGYEHRLITTLEKGELPLSHPQLKNYLQTLLSTQQAREMQSKNTALALISLLRH